MPTPDEVAVGQTVSTDFTVKVTDTLGASATDAATSVIVTAIAAASDSWLSDDSGNFDAATNWSGDVVPDATSNAVIDFADDPQVVHDSRSDTVNSLTNIAGNFVMAGGVLSTTLLNNNSLMAWSGGSIVLNGTAAMTNSGTLTIAPNGQRLSAIGITGFSNSGALLVASGLGVASIDPALTNTGAITVNGGTLSLNGGGSSNAYLLATGASGVLQFGAPAGQTSGGTFALTGGVYGGVQTVISGSTLDASAASGVFFNDLRLAASGALLLGASNAQTNAALVQGATSWANAVGTPYLSGSGTFTVYGGASLSAGVESGSGLTRLFGTRSIGGGFDLDGGRTVENDGFLTWSSGNIALGAGDPTALTQSGTLANASGAILYVTAAGDRLGIGSDGSGVLANVGVAAFYAGDGELDIDASVPIPATSRH